MEILNAADMSEYSINKIYALINDLQDKIKVLNLEGFKKIIIIPDEEFSSSSSDGSMGRDKNIYLPKKRTENNIDTNIEKVKSTIYHEFCHVDLFNKLPKIHKYYFKNYDEKNAIRTHTIEVYIEYITHLKSIELETRKMYEEFIESINNHKWIFNSRQDIVYMIKCSPYIISRDPDLSHIADNSLVEKLIEIKRELERLYKNGIKDDYSKLSRLEGIIAKYIK